MTKLFSHLNVPEQLEIYELIGSGRRSQVYKAQYQQIPVVVKVYNETYRQKYRQQYRVNIAEFEFERNQQLYQIDEIQRFIAKPYCQLLDETGCPGALVQECVDGIRLLDLITQLRELPQEILQAGHAIIENAARRKLYDLDISGGNIRVLKDQHGWYPKLYDFNLMPQHQFPPNPFMWLAFRIGLRSKNHRDYRSLREWERHARRVQTRPID